MKSTRRVMASITSTRMTGKSEHSSRSKLRVGNQE
jgi:hypothetical protein